MNTDHILADRLKQLRLKQAWSLDQLSAQSGVSRATLSRMENAEVSPTAHTLGRLCAVYNLTLSRLMMMVEASETPFLPRDEQPVWEDTRTGFVRRAVSPPSENMMCEILECTLAAGAQISYPRPARSGLEHHLVMLGGELTLEVDDTTFQLKPGDCLRYRLTGASTFSAHKSLGCKYHLVIV